MVGLKNMEKFNYVTFWDFKRFCDNDGHNYRDTTSIIIDTTVTAFQKSFNST